MSFVKELHEKLSGSLSRTQLAVGAGAVAAGLYGLVEALRVHLGATFFQEGAITGLLLVVGLLTAIPVGAAAGLVVGLPTAGLSRSRRAMAGFMAGLFALTCWDVAVRW